MDNRHRRYGSRYHAPSGNHGSPTNHDVWENNDARPDEGILFNFDALRSPEVGDDRDPHSNGTAILDGYEVRIRGFKNDIVADPNALPDPHTTGAVQRNAKSPRPRHDPGQVLQDTVFQSPQHIFWHSRLPTSLAASV
ncbi:MAG TPA: hypothetical protein VN950_29630 [Terriglobales bacterium]|nr:hypothetical protein [Terriglobales bacterium]